MHKGFWRLVLFFLVLGVFIGGCVAGEFPTEFSTKTEVTKLPEEVITPLPVPGKPIKVTALVSADTILVGWSVEATDAPNVAGSRVYRGEGVSTADITWLEGISVNDSIVRSYSFKKVPEGEYWVGVRLYNEEEKLGPISEPVSVKVEAPVVVVPDKVTGVVAVSSENTLTVYFNGQATADKYIVYLGVNTGTVATPNIVWEDSEEVYPPLTSAKFSNLSDGTYWAGVKAFKGSIASPMSDLATAAITTPVTPAVDLKSLASTMSWSATFDATNIKLKISVAEEVAMKVEQVGFQIADPEGTAEEFYRYWWSLAKEGLNRVFDMTPEATGNYTVKIGLIEGSQAEWTTDAIVNVTTLGGQEPEEEETLGIDLAYSPSQQKIIVQMPAKPNVAKRTVYWGEPGETGFPHMVEVADKDVEEVGDRWLYQISVITDSKIKVGWWTVKVSYEIDNKTTIFSIEKLIDIKAAPIADVLEPFGIELAYKAGSNKLQVSMAYNPAVEEVNVFWNEPGDKGFPNYVSKTMTDLSVRGDRRVYEIDIGTVGWYTVRVSQRRGYEVDYSIDGVINIDVL